MNLAAKTFEEAPSYFGYIYVIRCDLNNSIYIGKHKGEFDPDYKGSGKYIIAKEKSIGIDHFHSELQCYCTDKKSLDAAEKFYIESYRDMGYNLLNIAPGGDGGDTFTHLNPDDKEKRIQNLQKNSYFATASQDDIQSMHAKMWKTRKASGKPLFSDEARHNMSIAQKGKHVSKDVVDKIQATRKAKGYEHSEETKQKISNSNKGKHHEYTEACRRAHESYKTRYIGSGNPFYGKHHSEESLQIMREKNGDHTRNTVWMNNGVKNIRVPFDKSEEYLECGYVLGRFFQKRKVEI